MPENQEDVSGFVTTTVSDIRGLVECHYPCVPECTRAHVWENES
jgi:hypothetical protein